DTRAAELYRKEQAAGLIRSIRVLVVNQESEEKEPLRAYIRVVPEHSDVAVYMPRHEVASQPNLLNQAINDAISHLRHAEDRLAEFRALRTEMAELKQIRLRLESRQDEVHP
ncbi:MAG: hypothetical protein ACM33U_08660, partial [Solirubrobacterales bacterium]